MNLSTLQYRFGAGIYTSSTSSKSNDYSNNIKPSKLKAILLNKVVVGKGYKMMQDNTNLTAPPTGYDSVSGLLGLAAYLVTETSSRFLLRL